MMNSNKFQLQKGISLVEVMIVLVITSIVITMAVAQFGNAQTSFQTQNIARELKVNFERARFDSVKRRPGSIAAMSRVVINDETSFSLTIDRNQNNILEPEETFTTDYSGHTNAKIIAQGVAYPVTIVFDRKGHISAIDNNGVAVSPNFVICDNCTLDTIDNNNSYRVAISPTGTVTMLTSGETLPSHTDPTTTDVNDNFEIDTMVTVQNGTIPNGTPVPTPTPDPTPNPTVTPTPNPAATSSPTPEQSVCLSGEPPAQTGCVCKSPKYVRSNGQCK